MGRSMTKINRRHWLALTAAAAAGPLRAETRQEKGRRLMDEALAAMGGTKFQAIHNLTRIGRAYAFYRSQVRGLARMTVYETYEPEWSADADPKWLPVSRREIYSEKGDYYGLYLNGEGWEITFQGARPYPKDRIERYRAQVRWDVLNLLRYRLDEEGMYYYFKGVEIVDNVPTDAVDIADLSGDAVTVFVRQSDHLPVAQERTWRDPKTRYPSEERGVLGRFKQMDGVMLPWIERRERNGEKVFEMFTAEAEINGDLKPGLFQLGPDTPRLPEAP